MRKDITDFTSKLAVKMLERTLLAGREIQIPSLGITYSLKDGVKRSGNMGYIAFDDETEDMLLMDAIIEDTLTAACGHMTDVLDVCELCACCEECCRCMVGDDESEKVYREFWESIIAPTGKIDLKQLKKELYDYHYVLGEVSKVYDHLTCGRVSKPNAMAGVVIGIIEEMVKFQVADERAVWVAVADGLPEDKWEGASDHVLMCIKQGNGPVTRKVLIGYYDYYRQHWRTNWEPVRDGVVTHWQLLPDLPKA